MIGADCAALPVKITTFLGNYSNGIASLNWQTSQEINSGRFELYRSPNGNDFTLATTVVAAGNSNTPKNYSYNDHLPGNEGNHVFYKLKQIDKDGKFSFSNVIKLSISSEKASFQIFPNPAVTNFTTSFSANKAATASLLIRNTNGQTVYSKTVSVIKGNNAIVVNIESPKKGRYYVRLVNDDINYSGKFQVQ